MIRLLTPISHLFGYASTDKSLSRVIALSDCFEARERTATLYIPNTTHYHIDFDLNLGLAERQKDFLKSFVKTREDVTTLTFQASRDCPSYTLSNGMFWPASRPLNCDEQIQNTKTSLNLIRDIVGSDRFIGIENNNFYPTGAYDVCTSLAYLHASLEMLDIHLLLDIAHAKVTSYNRRTSFDDYLSSLLNTGKCKQIHICQPEKNPLDSTDILKDSHGVPSSEMTHLTLSLMARYSIEYLTCEYYQDSSVLADYLYSVRRLIDDGASPVQG